MDAVFQQESNKNEMFVHGEMPSISALQSAIDECTAPNSSCTENRLDFSFQPMPQYSNVALIYSLMLRLNILRCKLLSLDFAVKI